jgi:hypothetical protein
MYNLLIVGSLVVDLLVVSKLVDVSAAGSLVEKLMEGFSETLFVGRAPIIALSSTSFSFFAGLPVPVFVYSFS